MACQCMHQAAVEGGRLARARSDGKAVTMPRAIPRHGGGGTGTAAADGDQPRRLSVSSGRECAQAMRTSPAANRATLNGSGTVALS